MKIRNGFHPFKGICEKTNKENMYNLNHYATENATDNAIDYVTDIVE